MEAKISVIIPVYGVEKYIERCARSLFGQSLDSLQFIFVDDGSTDDSFEVVKIALNDFPNRANQVSFINSEANKGVGAARYQGLKEAKGEYVIHCDSDDWVEPDAYQSLYEKAIAEDADVVTCAYSIDYEDGISRKVIPAFQHDSKTLTFDLGPQTGSLVLKLIRRDFIVKNNLQFSKELRWGEDFCLSLKTLLLSKKTVSVNRPFYHYVQQSDSLTHTLTQEKCLSLIHCGNVIEDFLKLHGLMSHYQYQLNWLKFQLKQYLLIFSHTRDLPLWKAIYPECHQDILRYETMTYLKVSAWLIVHHLNAFALIVLKLRDFLSHFKNR